MQALGLHGFQDGGLKWNRAAHFCVLPRPQEAARSDLDLESPRERRARALREAWRANTWEKWRDGAIRAGAAIARALNAI
eukprot:306550-Alexandrium_andersonii.AAC.1